MKKHVKRLASVSAHATGVSLNKALKVLVPPQVLKTSSFFGGLQRATEAMVNLGSESHTEQKMGKQYVVRKSGGIVADTAIGIALFGVPITLVTSLFSDGCKVASHVLKEAGGKDQETAQVGAFLGDMSKVSNNFMKLFDVPSEEAAVDVHKSIEDMAERLKRENMLTKAIDRDLKELDKLIACKLDHKSVWCQEVQEKLSKIATEELSARKITADTKELQAFLKRPTIDHMKDMRDGLFTDFEKKRIPIRRDTRNFVNKFVDSLAAFPTDNFQAKMRSIMIRQYALADKTGGTITGAASLSYRLVRSMLNTTYKGASLFGVHYKKQIACAIDKDKCD